MALESLYPKVEMGDGQTFHLSVGQLRRGEGWGRIILMERKFTPTSVITLSNENNVWQERPSRFWPVH